MKDLKEFLDQLVKIEFHQHCMSYGLYPFQMFVEDKEGKAHVISLDLAGEMGKVYHAFMDYYKEKPKRIYLAVDFPALLEFENDFVCVFIYELDVITIFGIPYNNETGEMFPEIYQSELLDSIRKDLELFTNYTPISNSMIENTQAFKELNVVTKQIYKKKKMMDEVRHGFEVAKNVGIDQYEKTFYPRPYLLKVVKELICKFGN